MRHKADSLELKLNVDSSPTTQVIDGQMGAVTAHWIRLHQPSCDPVFEYYLSTTSKLLQSIFAINICHYIEKRKKINKKRLALVHIKREG